ncbi:MAG: HIT domain-containing protein [Gemmatimonadota bacterium]|nr:HIT domain-containing protein [Gemmatimonadota bacterium]MDE2872030.1 HIT domain-containing protein [Gemmatimonadota bacterium]
MKRVIAVDWSGAKTGAKSRIWLAEVRHGRLARLESGRDRDEVLAHLVADACRDPDVVVGLDFAFSFPRWFAEELGATSVEELWDLVGRQGEEWLRRCRDPFWGWRRGSRKPKHRELYRCTEKRAAQQTGATPKSVFQIGGAGQVGTGSIRGMPCLAVLRESGFSIWPFHQVRAPLAIEIYPRLLTGRVTKSDFDARVSYLGERFSEIDYRLASAAASSEDAFDAVVSAMVMSRHVEEISALTRSREPLGLIEGAIWWPRRSHELGTSSPAGLASQPNCPFCNVPTKSVVAESRHALAIRDRHPVADGHTLVVPKAHAKTLFAHTAAIQADVWRLVAEVRDALQSELNPDGLNVGLNDGRAAGQTVEHAHVHVIPRFDGDVTDPKGGIRWVRPDRAAYWDP